MNCTIEVPLHFVQSLLRFSLNFINLNKASIRKFTLGGKGSGYRKFLCACVYDGQTATAV
jgi:hypothetical protein